MKTYAELRHRELKFIEYNIKNDAAYKAKLALLYNKAQKDIERDIVSSLENFAYRENISMAEARRIADSQDILAYQEGIKEIIAADTLSQRALYELRRYNIGMRTNRLDLLLARINATTIGLTDREDRLLQAHLFKEMEKELIRQAGILAITVPSVASMERRFRAMVLTDVSGISFSDRIWANQQELTSEINNAIQRTIIQGENPRVAARNIKRLTKDIVGNKTAAANRIAVTETARAQSMAQALSFDAAEIDKYIWIAERDGRVCKYCEAMATSGGKQIIYKVNEMVIGRNAPPLHPYCRCSTAGYVERQ